MQNTITGGFNNGGKIRVNTGQTHTGSFFFLPLNIRYGTCAAGLQWQKKKMAVIYLMPKYVIEMVNDEEEMPLRCDNTGKGAIELMTEAVIDIKEQITLFLELSTSVATVWDV